MDGSALGWWAGALAASLLVVVTFPLDFGPARWSNPAVWADHPKAVPPAWTASLGGEAVPHRILEASEPTESTARGEAQPMSAATAP